MAAPKGNRFWEARSSHGRKPIFDSPESLWNAACEFFKWCEDNPLYAAETVKFQGEATLTKVPKMRAMTLSGLCLFLDIADNTFRLYRARDDFKEVTEKIDQVIRWQKFTGAAAELLNPVIIARDLGLKDSHEHTGKDGEPLVPPTDEASFAKRVAFILSQADQPPAVH